MRIINAFLLVFAFLATACTNPSDEKTPIIKVIQDEDIDFSKSQDRLAWASYWHISPDSRWWYTGFKHFEYWNEKDFQTAIEKKDMPPADNANVTFTDFIVKVNGNIGWASYDKKTETPEGVIEHTHEFRGMEKIAGVWKIVSASVHQYEPVQKVAPTIMWDTLMIVNKTHFQIMAGQDEVAYAKIIKNKTDTTTIENPIDIDIIDFNKDGFPDIRLTYIGNNSVNDLYLFKKETNSFANIAGMHNYPEAIRINDGVYYSYSRAGCADMNWVSYLFIVEEDSAKTVGTIYGEGCEMDSKKTIYIYKGRTTDDKGLVETLPIDTLENYNDHKWGFIRDYWTKNFKKFKK